MPLCGTVDEVGGAWWEAEGHVVRWLVAYEDEYAHCAQGKRLLAETHYRFDGNVSRLPELYRVGSLFCTALVGRVPRRPATSLRRLQVGPHVFWVEYESTESWMSNSGDGRCSVVGQEWDAGYHPVVRLPLWAADFVWGKSGLYAVDFNTAPGCRGTGVEKLLPADRACEVLEQALVDLGEEWDPKSLLP